MLKLSQPITSINGFKIGDKVRLKDGDGRPHIIKSFSIDGLKEFFFVVQFVDGTEAMLDNISLLPSNLDEAAIQAHIRLEDGEGLSFLNIFKAGVEWITGQGYTDEVKYSDLEDRKYVFVPYEEFNPGDKVIVQIRKKQ